MDLDEDRLLLDRVRRGDEPALEELVRRHSPALLRLAAAVLGDRVLAEDVVQETWIAALRSLDGFLGTSPLRSWLLAICANTARTRRGKEGRTMPFSAAWRDERAPAVEVGLFTGSGAWSAPVTEWDDEPYDASATLDLRHHLERAIDALPPAQRAAVVAGDVLGCSGAEAARLLGVSEVRQRALLRQARAQLRLALAEHRTVGAR